MTHTPKHLTVRWLPVKRFVGYKKTFFFADPFIFERKRFPPCNKPSNIGHCPTRISHCPTHYSNRYFESVIQIFPVRKRPNHFTFQYVLGTFILRSTNHFTFQYILGTFILRSTATDYEGDEIVYSIEGDTNGYFQIDPKNGDLKTARIIDKESLVSTIAQLTRNVISTFR